MWVLSLWDCLKVGNKVLYAGLKYGIYCFLFILIRNNKAKELENSCTSRIHHANIPNHGPQQQQQAFTVTGN